VNFDQDLFTLNWTTNNSEAQIIHYMAFGGVDVLAKVQSFAVPGALGAFSQTGVGFQPNLVFQIGSIASSALYDTNSASVALRVGAALGGPIRWTMSFIGSSGSNGAWRWHRGDRFVEGVSSSGDPSIDVDFVSMDPDGYTINNVGGGFATLTGILALR